MNGLMKLASKYPIAEIRGRGLMIAVEFDGPPNTANKVVQEAFDEGLILITAGINQTVRILPPLCITQEEIDIAIDALDRALARVF